MNDIQGLFASDFEYKPQGKSAPMVAPRGFGNLTHNSGGTRSYRHSNSVGGSFVDDDHDQIFGGSTNNRKIHDFGGLDVFGDVFGGPPVYTTTPERSGGNDEFDDFFRSIGGAPREKTSSDDKGSGGAEEGVDSFDDLIPGFGRSSTSGDRPTSQVSRPTNSTVNVTKTTSNVKEDTFVVLESTSPPMVPSSGLFRDPLEEINKLSKSGSLKDDGWPATGENSDDIFGRFEASFTSDMNNRGKDRNPLSSESYSKIPMDNSEESHQTIFNMPTVPDNIPNSVGKTESPPSNVNISPNGETNSQVNSSSTTEEDLVSPEDVWLTASEVLLSTQQTSSPPPSRPPPPRPGKGLKAERISPLRERQEKLERQQRKSEEEEGERRYEQERERIRVREEKEREERRLEKERERIREREEKEREERRLVKERETIAREIEREREEREREERIQEEREARAREIEREREEREREERIQEEREARAREIEREREEKEREERRLEKERERERETRAREIEREREENRRVVARVNKEARDRAAIAARLKAERVKAERLAVEKVMSNSRERLGRVSVEKVQTGIREREASEVEAKQMAEKAAAEEREKEIRERSRIERHQIIEERAANALAEMHQREFEAQRVHTERHRIAQTVDVEIERWAAGKQGNLRALLSTLQYVLWPECGWQPVALTDLIMGASVKKVYRKATLFVHPDKVQQRGANLQQKYVAEKVFDILKEAWNKFNSEELF